MASSPDQAAGAGGAARAGRQVVVWFRGDDLRLHDNALLQQAVQKVKSKEADAVLPVYCFDPRFFAKSKWGHVKTGPHR